MADPIGKNASSLKHNFRSGKLPKLLPNGKTRYQVIRDAMQSKAKLTVLSGTTQKDVIFNDDEKNNDTLNTFEILEDPKRGYKLRHSGGLVDIGDIYKTPAFGGQFGASRALGSKIGSTETTTRAESLQCYYAAAIAQNPNLKFEDMSQKILQATAFKCFTGGTALDKAYDLNLDWHKSSYFIAKGLVKSQYINRNYTFHRDDIVMKSIYQIKSQAYQKMGFKILSDDKWNPGDIWAIKSNVKIDEAFDGFDADGDVASSIGALNKRLQRLFDDKKVIAISLKAVTKESNLKIKRLNHSNDPRDTKPHKFGYVELAGKKGFFSAKQAYLITDDGIKVVMANKNVSTPPNFEIVLKGAKGGGGAWGVAAIPAAERHLGVHNLIMNPAQLLIDNAIKEGHERTIDKFWKNVELVQKSPLCKDRHDDILNEVQFKEQVKAASLDQIHSKHSQAAMLAALVKSSATNRSLWLDWMINYAGSTLKESSVYLKAYMTESQ